MQYLHCLRNNLICNYWCNTLFSFVINLKVVIGVHGIPSSFILYLNISNFSPPFFCSSSSKENVSHWVAKEVWFGEKIGIGLFARLKLTMHPIWPNISLWNICTKSMIFPWNPKSPSTHLLNKRGCIDKTHAFIDAWSCVGKARATCEWDQLQSDALQIKLTSKPTLVRLASSKLLVLLDIPTWVVVHLPQCGDQTRKGQWYCWFNSS